VYADLSAQHTAATEQMSAAEAAVAQAQQEHDALVGARAALDAEAKLPVGERRTKSEITIAKKAATAQVKAARARIEELGGDAFAARTTLDTLTPQLEAARLAVSPEQATVPLSEPGATDAAVQPDQQTGAGDTTELADFITSETRDVELRRAEMQRGQQKERELDAIAAARTEELGRTPDQQIAAAQVATDETPTAMAEAFARAKPRTEAEQIDRAVKGVQAAVQPTPAVGETPTISEAPAVAGTPEAVTPAPLATNIHDYIVEEIAKKKGTPEKKIKLAASIDTAIADITTSAAALAPDLRPKAIAAMVKTRVGGKVSADVQNEIATHIEQVVGAQSGAKTQFSKGAVEVGDLSQRSASSLRGLEKQIGDAYVDGQMSFDEYADRSRPVIQARVYAELRENKLGPAKGIADIHPGFKQIPVGTRVLATHGTRYPEPVMATVVGSRSTKSAIDGMVTLHPRVDFGDGKARTLTAGDIKQVFAPRLVSESNAALTQDEFEAMPPAAQEAATTAYNDAMRQKGVALQAELASIIGDRPEIKVVTFAAEPGGPIGSYTRTGPLKAVISMATNAKSLLGVADHEGYHFAEDWLLTSAEKRIVANAMKPGKPLFEQLKARLQQYDRENRTNLTDEVTGTPAEARAYGFEFWRRGELQAEGHLARIWQTLQQFFERISNAVKGAGFQSVEDVFVALSRGQMAEREMVAPEGRAAYESRGASAPDRASVAMQPSGENFYGPEANLFHVERIGSISVYHVTDPQTDEAIGSVSLGSVDGKPTILTDIRVDDQRAGAGERILRSVLATANADIYIENMLPGAVGFWKKMGVVLDTDFGNSWEHGNGFLDYTQYTEARQQKGQGKTEGRSGQAGEGTTGREAGGGAAQDTSAVATRFSKAAVEMSNRKADGGLEATQLGEQYAHLIEAANAPSDIWTRALGIVKEDMVGGVGRWWTNNISTPNFISASSEAFKNVYQTFNTYIRYGKILNEQLVRERLPAWYKASDADRKAAFDVMLKRTVEKYSKNSQELADLLRTLTPEQRTLYDQATNMIAGVLQRQFESQKATRKLQLTTPGEYEKWLAHRQEQVDSLLDTGYVPLRRYGDYSVAVYMEAPDGTRVKAGLEFFNSPSAAKAASVAYAREIERSGAALKVELGRRSKNERDTGVSLEQFLGTLRRQGIDISQAERERLVVAMTNADSLVRTQMMHREGLAGFSTDSMRVLHEFGVNTTNEIAYARFAPALDAALDGREVTADVNSVTGEPTITIDMPRMNDDGTWAEQSNDYLGRSLWVRDGPMSGFHKDRANALADAVLVPNRQSAWATKLRTAGVMYFIGGSISGAAVNAMSIPMLLVPHLSMHTDYLNATTTAMKSWKDSWQYYNILRDIDRMKNPDAETAAKLDAAGITKEMRAAIVAAADHIFDTEIHMMLGISQGTLYSKSRNLQRAAELWMAPFRAAEQTNRLASFMAAYKMASTTGVKQADGSLKTLGGQELFRFASGVVDATQNNYNASNAPGIMNNPIGALMFQFKSFPLFIIEAVALMHKQSPKSAVYMLLGLTAMAGVQGLPFAEELLDLIDVISQKLFGSPFNSRRAMRNVFKTAGEAIGAGDWSDALMRGMINEITGANVATRVSGGLLPGTRLGTADTPADRVLSEVAGAPYSMVKDTMSNVGGFVSGVATGDWTKAADAIRAGGPIALRNIVKGSEQLSKGYVYDTKGNTVTDVSTLDGLLQLTGLSSAKVTNMQDHNSIVIQVKAFHAQVSQDMQGQLVRAYRDGDTAKQQELIELRNKWNAQYPNMPIMPNAAAVRRAIMLSNVPLDRRAQLLLSRRMRSEFSDVFAEEE
jgi:hypothetical protein